VSPWCPFIRQALRHGDPHLNLEKIRSVVSPSNINLLGAVTSLAMVQVRHLLLALQWRNAETISEKLGVNFGKTALPYSIVMFWWR
jgi:hypothetical protein